MVAAHEQNLQDLIVGGAGAVGGGKGGKGNGLNTAMQQKSYYRLADVLAGTLVVILEDEVNIDPRGTGMKTTDFRGLKGGLNTGVNEGGSDPYLSNLIISSLFIQFNNFAQLAYLYR